MNILGLNAFHGDASAALLSDGQLTAAVEEERFNRIKHWAGFPALAAKSCLRAIDPADLAHVAISRDPRAHLWRKLGRVAARPGDWTPPRLPRPKQPSRSPASPPHLTSSGVARPDQVRIHHVEHHRAHLASAFFASPFEEAAIVSIDGFGDFSSVMWGVGRGNQFDVRGAVRFPHSLGLFYTAFTQFLGFPKYGDEYKMMGLSAYGEPRFVAQVRDVVNVVDDQIRLNLDYFIHHTDGVEMSWERRRARRRRCLFRQNDPRSSAPPACPAAELEQRHADLAASVQAVLEECYFELLNYVQRHTGLKKLCLAGGVALNCVANGMIFEKTPFQDVYIQPAAHDAGTSIGAALYVAHQVLESAPLFRHAPRLLRPGYTRFRNPRRTRRRWRRLPSPHRRRTGRSKPRAQIADGKIVGWFQGRMEFGPRALGNRSILADPRRPDMKDILNQRIKFREHFRPFCPSILAEATGEYFETDYPSPFMVQAYKIKPHQREPHPRRHPPGRHRPPADRGEGRQPALLEAAPPLRRTDRRAHPDQYLVQRERAHRQHSARRRSIASSARTWTSW